MKSLFFIFIMRFIKKEKSDFSFLEKRSLIFINYGFKVFMIYIVILSFLGFCSMGIDKWKAKHKKYRIPEKTLLLIGVFGGSIGSILGMRFFHHKTLHKKFSLGLPLILFCQLCLIVLYLFFI